MMQCEGLTLVKPSAVFAAEYTAMVHEFQQTDEDWFNNFPLALSDFPAFVQELEDEERGIGLPPGIVPQQTYWLLKEGKTIVGEIRLRPLLTPPFEQHHGHIGYNTRPSERRKGYATCQLALLLDVARTQNLARVMLTIEGHNPASVSVIEKNGGKLEWCKTSPETGETLSCYWIDL
jgi:predicted acetyltransferase